ncbi:MAG: hypothetical protein ACYCSN_02590 [Acidobacteriaceae bacterium]
MRHLAKYAVLFLAALPCLGQTNPATQTIPAARPAARLATQTIPATNSKALDGSAVVFPAANNAKPLLLMIGFSHQSRKEFDAWNRHLLPSYLSDPKIAYYEMIELQAAPSLVRPMILHSMRGQIHGAESSRYVPIFTDEEKWKSAVGYSAPDDAYLVVCYPSGRVAWQTHGAPDDAKLSGLHSALAKLATSVPR